MFLSILVMLKPEIISPNFKGIIESISILITLLLFNFFQKPSLFEVFQSEKELKIGLYIPDTRYAINFTNSKIQYFSIRANDKILFKLKSHFISLLDEGFIEVRKENGEIIHFQPIAFSWASKNDLEIFNRIIDKHNKTLANNV